MNPCLRGKSSWSTAPCLQDRYLCPFCFYQWTLLSKYTKVQKRYHTKTWEKRSVSKILRQGFFNSLSFWQSDYSHLSLSQFCFCSDGCFFKGKGFCKVRIWAISLLDHSKTEEYVHYPTVNMPLPVPRLGSICGSASKYYKNDWEHPRTNAVHVNFNFENRQSPHLQCQFLSNTSRNSSKSEGFVGHINRLDSSAMEFIINFIYKT